MRNSENHGEGGMRGSVGKKERTGLGWRFNLVNSMGCLLAHLFGTRVLEPFLPSMAGLLVAGEKGGDLVQDADR